MKESGTNSNLCNEEICKKDLPLKTPLTRPVSKCNANKVSDTNASSDEDSIPSNQEAVNNESHFTPADRILLIRIDKRLEMLLKDKHKQV